MNYVLAGMNTAKARALVSRLQTHALKIMWSEVVILYVFNN